MQTWKNRELTVAGVPVFVMGIFLSCGAATGQVLERANVSNIGAQTGDDAEHAAISATGRYVCFDSRAPGLVPDDLNARIDAFARDRVAGTTSIVSRAADPSTGHGQGSGPSVSADGRYVAFQSWANDLVPGDINGQTDVFVHDRKKGTTVLASVSTAGVQGEKDSVRPCISGNGRYVVFESRSSSLVAGGTNGQIQIFAHDLETHQTTLVSVNPAGGEADGDCSRGMRSRVSNCISHNGRYVVFVSRGTNLVAPETGTNWDIYRRDRQANTTILVNLSSTGVRGQGSCDIPSVSDDGNVVAFESVDDTLDAKDNNVHSDIYARNLQTSKTVLVSVAATGNAGNHDSWFPSISGDGRFVAFESWASDLIASDKGPHGDIFVRDLQAGKTACASMTAAGVQANHDCFYPALSKDGRILAFESEAWNLVPGDTNGTKDIFVAATPVLSHPPVLSWTGTAGLADDGVRPNRGVPDSTTFAFRVKITDPTGGPLTTRKVAVHQLGCDGVWASYKSIKVERKSGALLSGAIYGVATTLPNGVYRYRFVVANADGSATDAPTSWQVGPKPLGPPILCWSQKKGYKTDGVNPNSGSVGTTFIFKVLYMDGAGDAPRRKKLLIRRNGGFWRSYEMRGVTGGDRRTGKTYRKDTIIDRPGKYAYRFDFRDATGAATGDPTAWRTIGDIAAGGTIAFTSLSAAPTLGGAQLTFALSSSASVSARVLNIAGRPVKTLCSGRDCEAGTNTLLWNATSDQGTAMPNGTYLVEVAATTGEGGQARALARVTVRR